MVTLSTGIGRVRTERWHPDRLHAAMVEAMRPYDRLNARDRHRLAYHGVPYAFQPSEPGTPTDPAPSDFAAITERRNR